MLSLPSFTNTTPESYERLCQRIQTLCVDPKAQRVQSVTVHRRDDESPREWQQLIDELSETAGIQLDIQDGGSLRITWNECCEA